MPGLSTAKHTQPRHHMHNALRAARSANRMAFHLECPATNGSPFAWGGALNQVEAIVENDWPQDAVTFALLGPCMPLCMDCAAPMCVPSTQAYCIPPPSARR